MRDGAPSATARLIVRATVLLSRDARWGHLVPPRAAEASGWFLEASPGDRMFRRLVEWRWFRSLVRGLEGAALPGILLHYALRKRALEEVARRSLEEGFGRVVVLGAGFDTLTLRLHEEHPDVKFIEVDHPATQRVKREVLALRDLPRENLRLLPADLTRDGLASILGGGESPDTLVVAEGLLMYLGAEEVDAFFRSIREAPCSRLRLAFTFMEADETGRGRFPGASPLVDLWLRHHREPFRWALRSEDAKVTVETQGFEVNDLVRANELSRRYAPGAGPVAEGEVVCVADCRHRQQTVKASHVAIVNQR